MITEIVRNHPYKLLTFVFIFYIVAMLANATQNIWLWPKPPFQKTYKPIRYAKQPKGCSKARLCLNDTTYWEPALTKTIP